MNAYDYEILLSFAHAVGKMFLNPAKEHRGHNIIFEDIENEQLFYITTLNRLGHAPP